MGDEWSAWTSRLADELGSLADREFVNLVGPATSADPPRGVLARLRRPRPTGPVVRILRLGSHLLCESVAPFPTRDEPPVSAERLGLLRRAGWLMPGDEGYEPMGGDFCRVHVPTEEAGRAARLASTTLKILGVQGPELVDIDRSS